MAQQINHNVVINTESASGSSPLVDAAANHNTPTAAGNGTTQDPINTTNDTLDSSKSHNATATDANSVLALGSKGSDVGQPAAEPSAGNVAAQPTDVSAVASAVVAGGEKPEGTTADLTPSGVQSSGVAEDGAASADPSVHSDTDTSKADAAEDLKDGNRHVRSTSVKKATTFSKVNASKSYLAKSTTPTPPAAKVGEKVSAPASAPLAAAAKPRLIAKLGTSVGQKPRQATESPSGPDASKVWNKNRPVAPPPPKQFTDEELKQQYGIHLATRLQSDENGKDPKWADIDDEDDEWVPEAVVWMDGTKSNIAAAADVASTPKDEAPPNAPPAKPVEATRPVLTLMKKQAQPEATGPPKTILRPGAAHLAKSNGASASSSADKQTLKVKDGSTPSVKSPWATLPPVDKTSPINLPVQQPISQPVPFASQDARAYEQHAPPSQPAREIAADTFDRSYGQGEAGHRELFNSTNGRYEPAPDGRRGSMRSDAYARKPALLQRSSQTVGGPAEPSPAFQTRSGSQTDGPPSWGRRRNSSLSQQSGGLPGRRLSINRIHEPVFAPERRTSTVASHDTTSPGPTRVEAPSNTFAQQNAWQAQMPPPPAAGQPAEPDAPTQEQVMREKAQHHEEKRRLQKEQEEREEADKKARLQAKLAALGSAGMSRKEREEAKQREAAAAASAAAAKRSESPATTAEPTVKQNDAEKAKTASPALETQVAPPASTVAPPATAEDRAEAPAQLEFHPTVQKQDSSSLRASPLEQPQPIPPRTHLSPAVNNRAPFQQNTSAFRAPAQQPFGRSPLQNNSPWPSGSSTNIWGASGMGNGTFDSKNPFAAMSISQTLPPPPGMSRPTTSAHGSAQPSPQGLGQEARSPNGQQPSNLEQLRPIGPPGLESRADHFMSQPRQSGISMGRQHHIPGPIAPPSRAQPQRPEEKANKWMTASQDLPSRYASDARAAEVKPAKDAVPEARDDTFKETFKQTTTADGPGGKRRVAGTKFTVHDAQTPHTLVPAPAPPSTQTQPAVPVPTASPSNTASDSTVRLPERKQVVPPHLRHKMAAASSAPNSNLQTAPLPPQSGAHESTPPPPESVGHPVFDGDAIHPRVHLPSPRIVVRLPSANNSSWNGIDNSVTMPQRHIQQSPWGAIGGGAGGSRPLVQSEAWQQRFNGLFNKNAALVHTETPPSPPKTPPKQNPALAVASESRVQMPELPSIRSANVSLPKVSAKKITSPEGFTLDDSSDITSKNAIEPIFYDELSFGSKPRTRLPRGITYEVGFDSKINMLSMGINSRINKPVDVQSLQDFYPANFERHEVGVFVNMRGIRTKHNPIYWRGGRGGKPRNAKQPRGKGPAAPSASKEASPAATPNGTPTAGSRKTSYQKAPTPTNAQNQNAPATSNHNVAAPVASKRGGFKAPRGPRQGAAVPAVKAT